MEEESCYRTAFIEGTQEQYSIREDGVVIRNYHRTWQGNIKQSCRKCSIRWTGRHRYVYLFINNKVKSIGIDILLKHHFNLGFCLKCGKEINSTACYSITERRKSKIAGRYVCDECKKEATRVWNKSTRTRYILLKPIYAKKSREKYKREHYEEHLKKGRDSASKHRKRRKEGLKKLHLSTRKAIKAALNYYGIKDFNISKSDFRLYEEGLEAKRLLKNYLKEEKHES